MNKFSKKPPAAVYNKALGERVTYYNSVMQQVQHLKAALAEKHPIAFGFMVYSSFETPEVASTGIATMPQPLTEDPIGGHAVVIVGYDDSKGLFIVRNSWGPSWGDKGYFYMPYEYVLDKNLSSDFWIVTRMPEN